MIPALAISANAAVVVQGDASVANPLILSQISENSGLFAEIILSGAGANTLYVAPGAAAAPYANVDNFIRLDGASGGTVTVNFFSSYDLATNTGTAGTYTGDINFFDVDTFPQGNSTASDQVSITVDGGSTIILDPLTVSINNDNDRLGFIADGLVTHSVTDASVLTLTNSGVGSLLFDTQFGLASIPEPSSAALLGLGGLALIARRRRA